MSSGSALRARGRRLVHLVERFFGSLRSRPLDAETRAWVAATLEPAEEGVWAAMAPTDQAEGVGVARRVVAALVATGEASDPRWRAAALLHDAGKQLSGFGTAGRAAVTIVATALGDAGLRRWAEAPGGLRARMGRYVAHDELGAELLARAGARPEVAAWAGAHHRPAHWAATGIPPAVCRALAAADGEPVDEPRRETGGRFGPD
jgi:hypothetical protein